MQYPCSRVIFALISVLNDGCRWLLILQICPVCVLQPEREGCYTLSDVRRTRPQSSLLFNTMFNLHKFMAFENRDPFALRAEQLGEEGQVCLGRGLIYNHQSQLLGPLQLQVRGLFDRPCLQLIVYGHHQHHHAGNLLHNVNTSA